MRWIVACACLLALPAQAGTRAVKNLDGIAPGTRVHIEGVVSIRGSTPFTILVLEIADDAIVTLNPHTADLDQQLRSLDGLRVAVEGDVMPPLHPGTPRLRVERYTLLATPGGGDPIIGVVTLEAGACVLTTDDGKRFWILGEVAPALCEHAGARVWMVGKKVKHGDGVKPRESTPFTPTGYGVIDNAPAP
jgi:hypothetical protein